MRRVFLRGWGARTALGGTWRESVVALAEGRSAIGPIRAFDASGFPCDVAAAISSEVTGDRRLEIALPATREAWTDFSEGVRPERTGVFIGAESGRPSFAAVVSLVRAGLSRERREFDHERFGRAARPLAAAMNGATLSPAAVASALAAEIGAEGPVETVSLACASGAAAIAEAARAIRLGACDVALAGGVGADVDPFMMAGFGLLGALSTRGVSCPFDVRRDGFVVGEGAAMVVLSAERGGATVELAGAARTLDAHHLTAPDPEGQGARRAMRTALAEAGIEGVDYVQAHGTSTPLNDAIEARAIRAAMGQRLDAAHVGAVKGALGHCIAGAGAIGFLCAVEAVATGTLLPTAGLLRPDPDCALPHVVERALTRQAESALANSFAFGGANVSLVVRRCA